jgi:hypothetical protein
MPYVNKPRPYKKEYKQQLARGERVARLARARARYAVDKKGTDRNGNGKADMREGKDVSHVKMLAKGGTNEDGYYIESSHKNRSRNGKKPLKTKPKPKTKTKK